MSRSVFVLRPEPGASATAERVRLMGLHPVLYPLFEVAPVTWSGPDPDALDAVMFTSANAIRAGVAGLDAYRMLPAYAVGEATAEAVRNAGFSHVEAGAAGAAELARIIAGAGHRRVLHLCGRDVRAFDPGPLRIERRTVYETRDIGDAESLSALLTPGACLLVHSPRAATRLTSLVPEADRSVLRLVAISPAALSAASVGWGIAEAAPVPDDKALLALTARLCD